MSGLAPAGSVAQPLSWLLAGLDAAAVPRDLAVSRVALDSRAVGPDSLFLACPGRRTHGLAYACQAVEQGAVAIAWDGGDAPMLGVPAIHVPGLAEKAGEIAARLYGEPSRAMFVAGITGTDGKTTCSWLLARTFEALDTRCGYLGTLGYGLTDDLAQASHTTPDPVRVQDWLARLRSAGAAAVAFEVSSHALDQHRVDAVDFDVAVLTQVGRDHLDYHGDVHAYADAKRRLFMFENLDYAVLNADDACGRDWLGALGAGVTPVVYGFGDVGALAPRYVGLEQVEAHAGGLEIAFATSWGDVRVASRLIGRFNAVNLAAVLAVLLVRGIDVAAAGCALAAADTVPGRMEQIVAGRAQPLVVVDYAHTPNALAQALAAVRAHAEGRVYCVFGCGGERDSGKRPLMGAVATRHADRVWLTDDNPRGEDPATIVGQIRVGLTQDTVVTVVHDRAAAIGQAIAAAGAGDVVLIAGKGHETTQQIGDTLRAFDDRDVARRALGAA